MNVAMYTFFGTEKKKKKKTDLIWRTGDDLYPIKAPLAFNV